MILSVITGSLRRLSLSKIKCNLISIPKDKRDRLRQSYLKGIKIHRIMFYAIPFNLGILPYILYVNNSEHFVYVSIALIYVYVIVFENYMYRKTIIRELNKLECNQGI